MVQCATNSVVILQLSAASSVKDSSFTGGMILHRVSSFRKQLHAALGHGTARYRGTAFSCTLLADMRKVAEIVGLQKNWYRLLLLLVLAGAVFSCGGRATQEVYTAKSLEIRYLPGAPLREGERFWIDSIVFIHGENNVTRLMAHDTIFLTTTAYYSGWPDDAQTMDTATGPEHLNKINFIFRNDPVLREQYRTSPELSALQSGRLVISSASGTPVTIRFRKGYPLHVTELGEPLPSE